MALLSRIAAALTVLTASVGAAVVFENVERVPSSPVDDTPRLVVADSHQLVQGEDLDETLRNYRVRLRADGRLPGRINIVDPATDLVSPAADLNIALLQNGNVVTELRSGADGIFEADNVPPGVYSLVGHGPEGFIAYGLEVMPAEFDVDHRDAGDIHSGALQEIQQELQIDSLAVPPTDGPTMLNLGNTYLPAAVVAAVSATARDTGPPSPPRLAAPAGAAPRALDEAEDSPAAETIPSANLRQHDVRLAADGSLTGRMRSMHPQTGQLVRFRRLNVFLVRDNEIVAQAPVNPLGVFTFPDLAVGFYSFVAAGTDGFTAFRIHTVSDAIADAATPDELIVPVVFAHNQQGAPGANGLPGDGVGGLGMFGTLAPTVDTAYILYWLRYYYGDDDDAQIGGAGAPGDITEVPGIAGAPRIGMGGFGAPGGFAGAAPGSGFRIGGGFLGNATGFGTLLGEAGLVAGAVALADDDRRQPISPVR